MLTKKQYELLMFINRRLAQDGVSPSFEEMKEALGLKSKSGIHRLISGLEERGFIRRLPHRARALEVMKRPEEMAVGGAAAEASEEPLAGRSRFSPKVIRGDFKAALPGAPRVTAHTINRAIALTTMVTRKSARPISINALK